MKQIVSIHLGQAGIQLGNSCWELFCLQHGITPDARREQGSADLPFKSVFAETSTNKYVPRALYFDLEPTVVDQVRTCRYRNLFHPDWLVSGKEDSANIFTRGQNVLAPAMMPDCMDKLRRITQACDSLQGFIIYHATGGGTGSGFGARLLQTMSVQYGKKAKVCTSIFPSPQISTAVVEPYNAVLSMPSLIQHCDLQILFDNQAIYDIYRSRLGNQSPSYNNVNRVIAQAISSITSSTRFGGTSNYDLRTLGTNVVPYPKIHFSLASIAHLISQQKAYQEDFAAYEITEAVFQKQNFLAKCDPSNGAYIACSLTYKGDVIPKEVNSSIRQIKSKKSVKFLDWSPSPFKVAITDKQPKVVPGSELHAPERLACMLSNTTAMRQILVRLGRKYDIMYAKRAFVHWYIGDGLEEGEFASARNELDSLQKDYEQVGVQTGVQ